MNELESKAIVRGFNKKISTVKNIIESLLNGSLITLEFDGTLATIGCTYSDDTFYYVSIDSKSSWEKPIFIENNFYNYKKLFDKLFTIPLDCLQPTRCYQDERYFVHKEISKFNKTRR